MPIIDLKNDSLEEQQRILELAHVHFMRSCLCVICFQFYSSPSTGGYLIERPHWKIPHWKSINAYCSKCWDSNKNNCKSGVVVLQHH